FDRSGLVRKLLQLSYFFAPLLGMPAIVIAAIISPMRSRSVSSISFMSSGSGSVGAAVCARVICAVHAALPFIVHEGRFADWGHGGRVCSESASHRRGRFLDHCGA